MKFCLLTPGYPRYKGDDSSVKDYLHDLGKELTKRRIEVHVIAPHAKGIEKEEVMDGVYIHRFQYFYPSSFQTLAYTVGIPEKIKTIEGKIQVPFFFLSQLFNTIKLIRKEKIDVINSHWLLPMGLVGAICRSIFDIPHITTIHSSEITLIKKSPFGRKITEFIVNNTDKIVSVSSHRADELLTFISTKVSTATKEKIEIIPMGIDLGKFRNEINKNNLKTNYNITSKFVILFVGRLVEVKGCEYLIKGFKSVIDEVNDVQLIIVGSGPLEAKVKKLAKKLNMEKYVRFEGFVEHNTISDYYSLSDIVVFPSIVDSSGFEEGLPVVLLEALAVGKAVVATRTKGVMEIIKEGYNGFLVEQKNPEQIAEKVLELLGNEELGARFSKNALDAGKKYDWDVIVEKYVKILAGVR